MTTLQRFGLDKNTLVVYAADQGWMGGQNGIWGMGDHLRPVGAFEPMMRIPLIFRQPGVIPANKTSDCIVSNYDFLPSVLASLGLADRMPQQPKSPGRDFSAVLQGRDIPWENEMFYEMETCRAIRAERWKYVERRPNWPHELYDMQSDPHERFNQFGQSGTQAIQQELSGRLAKFFQEYADPKYDLWRGGRSKASRLTKE